MSISVQRSVVGVMGAAALFFGVIVTRRLLDRRPIYPAAALSAPGTIAPAFDLAKLGGGRVQSRELVGRPVVLALWSLECSASRAALSGIGQLQRDYATDGVSVVIIADNRDTTALRTAMTAAGVTAPVALAEGRLMKIFDRSSDAPSDSLYRISFALPSYLLVDAAGVVVFRSAGVPLDEYRSKQARFTDLRRALDVLISRTALRDRQL